MPHAITGKFRSRKRQLGQAIYLGLAAIIFLSLMTYAAFNISQMTHAKAQTMNAADAGAYTIATVVARDLNFMAYTNRAMAANHAVIGQLVSLASLSQMIYLAADDLEELEKLSWIPYVGPIFEAIGSAFGYVKDAIENIILPGLQMIANVQNALIKVISIMQLGVHGATAIDAKNAVEKVIKANDPELEWATTSGVAGGLTTASNIKSIVETFFGEFSGQVSDSDDTGLGRMREVVNLSRDGFTIERNWVPLPSVSTPVLKLSSKWLFHGGTQLSSDNKTWVGVDGAEVKYKQRSGIKWKTKYLRWWLTGEVAGSNGANDWKKLSHGDLSSDGHKKAYNNRKHEMEDTYDGIQSYWELSEFKAGDRSGDSPAYVVLVYKPVQSSDASNVTRTENAMQVFQTDADNPFHLKEGRPRIYGVAASQVYFRRPAKNDNDPTAGQLPSTLYPKGTYATLFAPYWQPRLTDLPAGMAAALMAVGD